MNCQTDLLRAATSIWTVGITNNSTTFLDHAEKILQSMNDTKANGFKVQIENIFNGNPKSTKYIAEDLLMKVVNLKQYQREIDAC
jgi:hypothetical protein